MDKVMVVGIRLGVSLGLLPWEHETIQTVEVDVEALVDTRELIRTGKLEDGVDYTQIIAAAKRVASRGHVELVEVFADKIAHEVLGATAARQVTVCVRKYAPCAHDAKYAAVEVTRSLS